MKTKYEKNINFKRQNHNPIQNRDTKMTKVKK